jgi:hypothetical protein
MNSKEISMAQRARQQAAQQAAQPSEMTVTICVTNTPAVVDGISYPLTDIYDTIAEHSVLEEIVINTDELISSRLRPMTRNYQNEIRALAQMMQKVRGHARNR